MTIELADGTKLEGVISHYQNQIWIETSVEVATAQLVNLLNPEKTKVITEHWPAQDKIYTGFTRCDQVRIKEDGHALIYLTGGDDAKVEEHWTIDETYLPKEFRKEQNQNGSEQDIGSGTDDAGSAENSEPAGGNS
jgi:hypothetical protein